MSRILNFKSFEALKPSQFRDYMKVWDELPHLKDRYKDIFFEYKEKYDGDKNAYRIYLPLQQEKVISETERQISEYLNKNNYELLDYTIGQARFIGAKNPKRIGQVLTQLERNASDEEKIFIKDLMKKFVEDPIRKQGNTSEYLVCISRHPYDIAGADTDRKWDNCMTMGSTTGGQNVKYLIHDVREGSLVSYLIKINDKNISDPVANCAIKPYINQYDKTDFILVKDNKVYPQPYPDFSKTVDAWVKEVNGSKGEGIYCLNPKLYNDNLIGSKIINIKEMNPTNIKRIAKAYGIKMKDLVIHDDLSIDVLSDVDLSERMLVNIPLNFNKVYGTFDISNNRLKTLVGCPKIIEGDFIAYRNRIESLDGGPIEVGGEYSVMENDLKTLQGAPQKVGGLFDVSFNPNIPHITKQDIDSIVGEFRNKQEI
jgi:hypothetical protein